MAEKVDKSKAFSGAALVARLAALGLLAALIADRAAALPGLPFEVGDVRHNVMQVFVFWSALLAPGFYICALWETGSIFARVKRGDAFGPALVRGIRWAGINLVLGALSALLLAPALARYAGTPAPDAALDVDIVNLTFLFIGAALVLLASKGAALKSELESFI
jgi:hypothetical protein